jgi:hypothetical protein
VKLRMLKPANARLLSDDDLESLRADPESEKMAEVVRARLTMRHRTPAEP